MGSDELYGSSPRRDFLKLTFGGALAAASAALESARTSAEPLGQPNAFAPDTVLDMARELAKLRSRRPDRRSPTSSPILLSSNILRFGAIPVRQCGTTRNSASAGAAAPRLHFRDADAAQRRRKRSGAATDLRSRRVRLRQAPTAGGSARSRLFRRARAERLAAGRGWQGSGDLPGRDIFSQSCALASATASTRAACRSAPPRSRARNSRYSARVD